MPQVSEEVIDICKHLLLSDEDIKTITDDFLNDIQLGLKSDEAIVKCFNTYVQDLPDGKETGKYLGLDLGGNRFRIILVTLSKNQCDVQFITYNMPHNLMTSTGVELFDHIAKCLSNFVLENKIMSEHIPLAFTFSFPLVQQSLSKGLLERWTKGFNVPDAIGQDVVQLLRDAIKRRGDIQVTVCAVLNNTTGTLLSGAWKEPNCRIGLIVGTGMNICYMEKIENYGKFDGDKEKPYVIINTECGAFGDDGKLDFLRTEFDKEIDKNTINCGRQIFEKMISGMYLGELVRAVMIYLIQNKVLFFGKSSVHLNTKDAFKVSHMADIERDRPNSYKNIKRILQDLDVINVAEQDFVNIRYICECFAQRSAKMVAAITATLVIKMGFSPIMVGVDGFLFRQYPRYSMNLKENIKKLIPKDIKFDLCLGDDGGGRGAALLAAVISRQKPPL